MLVPRRHGSLENYKYGFNGKEKDDEIKGEGAQYDYGFRIYDPRLNRFLSVDPLTKKFAMLTPYQFASNNPIWAIDLDGLEAVLYDINFDGDKITTTKIELAKSGSLGDGVAIRTNKGGSTTYFYGNEIPSGNGEAFTKGYEGKELKSYKDQYGNLTAGYGHLLNKDEQKSYPEGTAVTEDQINTWFTSDYSTIKSSVQKNKTNDAGLTGTQEDAVVDFYYNVGPNHKANFKGSGKGGNFFLGYMVGGKGIWKRRFAEKLLYEEGKYLKFDPVNGKKDIGNLDQLYKDNIPAAESTPAPTEEKK
jgi:RHS repeat-associated protein